MRPRLSIFKHTYAPTSMNCLSEISAFTKEAHSASDCGALPALPACVHRASRVALLSILAPDDARRLSISPLIRATCSSPIAKTSSAVSGKLVKYLMRLHREEGKLDDEIKGRKFTAKERRRVLRSGKLKLSQYKFRRRKLFQK